MTDIVKSPIPITGVWLRREGDHVVVLVEFLDEWVEVVREHVCGSFSHIVEPSRIRARGIMNS